MCPCIINLCKLEGVFDFPTPYNHTASEQSREKGLPGWTCKKEKNIINSKQGYFEFYTCNTILFIER